MLRVKGNVKAVLPSENIFQCMKFNFSKLET
jgi:hypothetical protein